LHDVEIGRIIPTKVVPVGLQMAPTAKAFVPTVLQASGMGKEKETSSFAVLQVSGTALGFLLGSFVSS
jgi:hypothetical protein